MASWEFKEIDEEYLNRIVKYEIDCDDGNGAPMACQSVGEFYSVVKDDHAKAADVYEKNCAKNNFGPSCFNLGRLLVAGKGVEQSDERASQMFEKACKNEHLQGCHHHALMMYYGLGYATKRVPEAVSLFERTCEEGDQESCYMAGTHFLKEGEGRNPVRAVNLLEKSCARSHGPSCFNLAVLYKNGDVGVERNEEKHNHYRAITETLVKQAGALLGTKTA